MIVPSGMSIFSVLEMRYLISGFHLERMAIVKDHWSVCHLILSHTVREQFFSRCFMETFILESRVAFPGSN